MFVFLVVHLLLLLYKAASAAPTDFVSDDGLLVKEVPYGETVLLKCRSNAGSYNFEYWLFNKANTVIGPSNSYDKLKYRYEILSGNLTIRAVTKEDEGLYSCVSKEVRGTHVNVQHVKVTVRANWQHVYEHDSSINTIRTLIVLIVLVIVAAGAYYLYKMWRDRYKYPRYLEQDDDDDDDEDAEEIFTAPSTSGLSSKPGPSTSKPAGPIVLDQNSTFDNISTDFKSILDTANDK